MASVQYGSRGPYDGTAANGSVLTSPHGRVAKWESLAAVGRGSARFSVPTVDAALNVRVAEVVATTAVQVAPTLLSVASAVVGQKQPWRLIPATKTT